MSLRRWKSDLLYYFLNSQKKSVLQKGVDILYTILIFSNVIVLVMMTVESFFAAASLYVSALIAITLFVYLYEEIFCLLYCTELERYRHPFWGRIRFFVTPLSLVNIVLLVALLVSMINSPEHRDVKIQLGHLVIVASFLKLFHYSNAIRMIGRVFSLRRRELGITFVCILFVTIVISTVMYYIERDAQPDKFASIPSTMWWCIITMTTVGYGDVVPVTDLGKLVTSLLAFVGVGFIALPVGILSSGFSDVLKSHQRPPRRVDKSDEQRSLGEHDHSMIEDDHDAESRGHYCPHCGKPIK